MDIVALQVLVAAGLLAVSLWWYRRNRDDRTGTAGRVLWAGWIAFGLVSVVILTASGPEAVLLGSFMTWAFCVVGTVLGARLLGRSFPARSEDYLAVAMVFALVSMLAGFVWVWTQLMSALSNS